MSEVNLELESQVNEVFVRTIVTQKFKNPYEQPLELKIYIDKNDDILFSSFQAKIGESIMVKSKLIKKEKAEVKYTDSISSGNAAIFVSEYEGKIIINMGNIPAKEEVIFISEFIHFSKHSDLYEFEILRNLPIFEGKDETFYNTKLKEKINIKTINKIFNIAKDINVEGLKIIEEKYLNEEKNEYLISYEIKKMQKYKSDTPSKIFFDTNHNEPSAFLQKSSKLNEDNYIIQCKPKYFADEKEKEISPALFIFLIDQSGSMWGDRIEITKKALQLFLQSLPANSYYQLVGFGSDYKKYDEKPKEYTQENISESIKLIETLDADLGGTNIYDPLSDVSFATYKNINLRKNIFLLTDGYIDHREKTLDFIKNNNSKFRIFSIGIGNSFDERLIKESGLYGRGGYNFCRKLYGLNSIIAKEINNVNNLWISNFKAKCNLDNDNICETKMPEIIMQNDIVNLNYIIPRKTIDKINLEITYNLDDNEKIEKKYEIVPKIIPEGEEISKLIIKDFINNIPDEDEKTKKSLKYQIFNNKTSLFAEVELSEKISEEMKLKIIGDEKKNILEIFKPKEETHAYYNNYNYNNNYTYSPTPTFYGSMSGSNSFMGCGMSMGGGMPMGCGMSMGGGMPMGFSMMNMPMSMAPPMNMSMSMAPPMNMMNMGMNNMMNMGMNNMMNMGMNNMMNMGMNNMNNMNSMMNMRNNMPNSMDKKKEININDLEKNSNNEGKEKNKKIEEEKNKIIEKEKLKKKLLEESRIKNEELERKKLAEKEEIMKIIKTQDFINGYWEINDKTKIILEKCKKEYELLKGLKDKSIDDKVAITILIIYYINKEHFKLVSELTMIFKKAKLFIEKEIKCSYEEIVENLKSI